MRIYLMNLKVFLSSREVKIIIFATLAGGLSQILCKRYIKNHPEFFEDSRQPKFKKRFVRGGEFVSISLVQVIITFLGDHGLTTGVISGFIYLIGEIPVNSISKYLSESMPQNLSDKKKFILVKGEQLYLEQCDQNLKYLFYILQDETIPFEERKKIGHSVLTKFLNLKTPSGRRNSVLCIQFIIFILFTNNSSSFCLMMKSLILGIKKNTISKQLARLIVRRLIRQGILIDPELLEII